MRTGKGILRILVVTMLVLVSSVYGRAQFATLGSDPARAKWRQIQSENYTVIYPQEIDSLARRYLYLLETWRPKVMEPLQISPKRIPVVLHPYSTLSNGMVAWAPKRMDLYTTPDAYDGYPDLWDENLVIHESRHVGQCEHFTRGLWKGLYYLLGEQSTGLALAIYQDKLSMEGDAVIAETELTKVGRGRRADFVQYQRAALLNGDFRTVQQLIFGSHRNYTPNHYVIGYLMQANMRMASGDYFFPGYYGSQMVRYWYNPWILQNVYKTRTGASSYSYYKSLQPALAQYWHDDLLRRGRLSSPELIPNRNTDLYTDFRHPVPYHNPRTGALEVYARMSGMEYNERLVLVDTAGHRRFMRNFNSVASKFTLSSDGKIYWTETIKRQPYGLEDYSVLRSYDLNTHRSRSYRTRTRYYNPAPSPGGDTIALVQYPVSGSSFLVLADAGSGREFFRVEAPGRGQIKELAYVGEDIYASIVVDKGLGIYRYAQGQWSEVVPQQFKTVKGLKSMGRFLYFTSDLDDLQNIYAFNVDAGLLYRLTNSEFGASDAQYDPVDGMMYYAAFSHDGYRIAREKLEEMEWREMSFDEPVENAWAAELSRQAQTESALPSGGDMSLPSGVMGSGKDSLPWSFDEKLYPSKRYSKLSHLFRFHSWAPVYYNVDRIMSMSFENLYQVAGLGLTAYSQNSLGNAITMLAYSYYGGYHAGHVKFEYTGLGPVIELSANVNERGTYRNTLKKGGLVLRPYLERVVDKGIVNFNSRVLLYYPLNLYSGGWQRGFVPQLSWDYNNDLYYSYEKDRYVNMHMLTYAMRYYQMLPISESAIFPRYGFSFTAMGASVPGSGENFGHLYNLSAYFYLPGFTRSQGVKLSVAWQHQLNEGKTYYLGTSTSMPRGYLEQSPTEKYFKVTADYALPIYLGDVSIPKFMYFRRLQLIPFADFAMDYNPSSDWKKFYSVGLDVLLDFNFINFISPVSLGFRYSRTGPQLPGISRDQFQMLFNIAL